MDVVRVNTEILPPKHEYTDRYPVLLSYCNSLYLFAAAIRELEFFPGVYELLYLALPAVHDTCILISAKLYFKSKT